MIKSYNLETSELSFHKKVYSNYIKTLNSIHPQLKECKPILSGSAAVKLVIHPNADFNDLDFYFNSEEHYNNTKEFLLKNSFVFKTETRNCIVFSNKKEEKDIQLIKTFYGGYKNVITYHDFLNCSVAIENNMLYLNLNALKAWKNKELILQNIQCNPSCYLNSKYNDLEISSVLSYIANLMYRIQKYEDRYGLKFNSKSIEKLAPFKTYLTYLSTMQTFEKTDLLFCKVVYYGSATKDTAYQKYINDFIKLLKLPIKLRVTSVSDNKLTYRCQIKKHDWSFTNENLLF